MQCDSSNAIWNRPDVQAVDPRSACGNNKNFEIETSTLIVHIGEAKWRMLASPVKRRSTQPTSRVNRSAISLLDDWLTEDEGDQKETWKDLTKALDENRSSDRKLFS